MIPLKDFYSWYSCLDKKYDEFIMFATSDEAKVINDVDKLYDNFFEDSREYTRWRNLYETKKSDMEDFIENELYEKATVLKKPLNNLFNKVNYLERKVFDSEEKLLLAMDICNTKNH